MPLFQNEAFQFDFFKCLALQTLRQSVAMATDLSFHFVCKLLQMFYFVKINLIILFKLSVLKEEPLTP